MIIFRLALKSLANRWLTALLTVIAIALSVMLFLGVEKIRNGARSSFANTISGTDLIIGSRAGSVQLLLYSVFRIGNATANINWQSYQDIAKRSEVAWAVPMSLGDSHKGYRVLGTTTDFFQHYKYRSKQQLQFQSGAPFKGLLDTVIGADVAKALGYKIDTSVIIAHGLGATSFVKHKDKPFKVVGILKSTGTPVDRTVFVSLQAIEAIHVGWQTGRRVNIPIEKLQELKLEPKSITAALIGLKRKGTIFRLQRHINTYKPEPLSAILPGVALQELWSLVGTAETALAVVSLMVILTALLGMVTMILTTLNERRREIAILRSVGARPHTIMGLLVSEAGFLTTLGVIAGTISLYITLFLVRPVINASYGLYIEIAPLTMTELGILVGICASGFIVGLIPAIRAYGLSLADGMLVRN
ncbi:MAG: ABC transporter permease [Methyloligellaceae bacterium]